MKYGLNKVTKVYLLIIIIQRVTASDVSMSKRQDLLMQPNSKT